MQLDTLSHSRAASNVNMNPLDIEVAGICRDATGRWWDNPYRFGPKGERTNKWVQVRQTNMSKAPACSHVRLQQMTFTEVVC